MSQRKSKLAIVSGAVRRGLAEARGFAETEMKNRWAEAKGVSSEGLVTANTGEALKLSAYFCAVRILSEVPASLPLDIVVHDKDGNRTVDANHFLKKLFRVPNSYQTGYTFREYLFQCLALYGNAIAVIITNNYGVVTSLIPITPYSVTSLKLNDGRLVYTINDTTTGIKGIFLDDEVIHIKQFAGNGIWGRDPVTYARENLGLALATERFGNTYFAKKGNHKAVIEMEKSFPPGDAFAEFQKRYKTYGDHDTPILEYGMKYHQLSIPLEQAQFIASRQFAVEDVARWFNLAPHMLKDLSRATFSNIEHLDIEFVKYSLQSTLKNVEEEMSRKLIFTDKLGTVRIKHNLSGLLRGDITARTAHYAAMVPLGVYTRNEVRDMENFKRLDGLDKPLDPVNITGKQEEKK